ncbi:MAG: polysaccharide lyase family 8 super-sandwich domain-containing protein [Phocaeicola sp.]
MARKTDRLRPFCFLHPMAWSKIEQPLHRGRKRLPFFCVVCCFFLSVISTYAHTLSTTSPLFDSISERILSDLLKKQSSQVVLFDPQINESLSLVQEAGACIGVNYQSTHRTDWEPLKHLDTMLLLALGYTHEGSSYFESDEIKATLVRMLTYWLEQSPRSSNWYQNQIAEPQRMGELLLLLQAYGNNCIPQSLLEAATTRMKEKGGNPQAQKGANRVDVALHGVYRACLLKDEQLLQDSFNQIYSTITYTDQAEGIQYDYSFTQHGRQLHIGSYGDVFLGGVVKACSYAVGTPYALPSSKLTILTNLVTKAYLPAIRGQYIAYNVIGRSSTRPDATSRKKQSAIFKTISSLDPANRERYRNAIQRINGDADPNHGVEPYSHHFFCSDYTLHQRPAYLVDVRMLSNRTVRNEYLKDNGEGIKQYFMSYGAMGIYVHGDEYSNIFPVWDYSKVPGITAPSMCEIPRTTSYIKKGENCFSGGVTNALYTVSGYQMEDYDTLYEVNTKAQKGWFCFDQEIVCLGNGIASETDFPIYTTLNQTLLKGEVHLSEAGVQRQISLADTLASNRLDWVYHNGVAYYLNDQPKVLLSLAERVGAWSAINTNFSATPIRQELFTLAIDHGVSPQSDSYNYLIVPGVKSLQEVMDYNPNSIEVIENSKEAMIVWHKKLQLVGAVFYQPIQRHFAGIHFECDKSCVVLFEQINSKHLTLYVADPTQGGEPIELKVATKKNRGVHSILYAPEPPMQGSTFSYRLEEMPKLK